MKNKFAFAWFLIFCLVFNSCKTKANNTIKESNEPISNEIKVGAEDFDAYLPMLKAKKVGLVINHTSQINGVFLLDILLEKNVNIKKIYTPEHGLRGNESAGSKINNGKDEKTNLPIISLYGKNKKPSPEDLANIDILVFDIQDVGARFYTYISTLFYVMQAAAEQGKEVIILDRPNPLGKFVDGPVLDMKFTSFVGIAPIPVLHGMTVGEIGQYYNGEKLIGSKKCKLSVIKVKNYDHNSIYNLPVKPSPNLPNMQSIYLYASLCWFEPTKISVGRGTNKQFQVIGGPDPALGSYTFTPEEMEGAKDPVNKGIKCYGLDLSNLPAENLGLSFDYIIDFYKKYKDKNSFFTNPKFFNLLAGNDWLINDIKAGKTSEEIKAKYSADLEKFKKIREKYLLYP